MMVALQKFIRSIHESLLLNKYLRYIYCRLRYFYFVKLHGKLEVLDAFRGTVNANYNMTFSAAAFGCGQRMSLLLYPAHALLGLDIKDKELLIVGPRTEDDIVWARALGFNRAKGLDIFSYSPMIALGDIHETEYGANKFDAVLAGWILPYISNPQKAINEICRIVKPGGIVGFSWHYATDINMLAQDPVRSNILNSMSEILELFSDEKHEVIMKVDPATNPSNYAVVFVRLKGD